MPLGRAPFASGWRTASPSSSTSSSQRGARRQEVGAEVQRRVADYLERMAGARPSAVDVV